MVRSPDLSEETLELLELMLFIAQGPARAIYKLSVGDWCLGKAQWHICGKQANSEVRSAHALSIDTQRQPFQHIVISSCFKRPPHHLTSPVVPATHEASRLSQLTSTCSSACLSVTQASGVCSSQVFQDVVPQLVDGTM